MIPSERQTTPWRKHDGRLYRWIDAFVLCLGLGICILICRAAFGNTPAAVIWTALICFYFIFYSRIIQIIYWSWDTLRYLRRSWAPPGTSPATGADEEQLPVFHILVAAYESAESIGPVIRAIANQGYPASRLHAWFICEHSEKLKKEEQARQLAGNATRPLPPDAAVPGTLLRFYWRCAGEGLGSLDSYLHEVTRGRLCGYLNDPEVWPLALEDLLLWFLRTPGRKPGMLATLARSQSQQLGIEREADRIEQTVDRIVEDFTRLLGSPDVYRRSDLELELVRAAIRKRPLRRLARELFAPLAAAGMEVCIPDLAVIERTARRLTPSTQEVVQQAIERLPSGNLHLLDPHNRGFKPGALNAAYREIKKAGLLANPGDVYFLIIDSDSLLPANALRAAAAEVLRNGQERSILQMASIPTANFFAEGWFSKFIAFADAIGAVGKWSRSTRRQLKPDLHAGSGVVVPATLTEIVERIAGRPWDESTLTEDARLIIGQFGLMNGARNKTGMVPVYLLEAVPNQPGAPGDLQIVLEPEKALDDRGIRRVP